MSPCLLLLVPSSRAGCGALNTHPDPFFFPPGGCDALNTLLSLSLFLSLFCVCLSLSLSFSRSSLSFFPFFFFPSLGYFLYFLFVRLGMACSSSASLPSRPLSSTRSRSFFALVGVVALGDPKPGFPVVLVSCLGFCPRRPNLGPFCFFWVPLLRLFSVGVFARFWGAGFSPPKKWFFLQEKRETSPLVEGRVCAEWQKTLPPIFSSSTGGPSICCVRWSNEAATANADIEADHLDVPVHLV